MKLPSNIQPVYRDIVIAIRMTCGACGHVMRTLWNTSDLRLSLPRQSTIENAATLAAVAFATGSAFIAWEYHG